MNVKFKLKLKIKLEIKFVLRMMTKKCTELKYLTFIFCCFSASPYNQIYFKLPHFLSFFSLMLIQTLQLESKFKLNFCVFRGLSIIRFCLSSPYGIKKKSFQLGDENCKYSLTFGSVRVIALALVTNWVRNDIWVWSTCLVIQSDLIWLGHPIIQWIARKLHKVPT